jgi:hypothetical protein
LRSSFSVMMVAVIFIPGIRPWRAGGSGTAAPPLVFSTSGAG